MLRGEFVIAGFDITATPPHAAAGPAGPDLTDSASAWLRLVDAVLLSTLGGVGMWSFMVLLPAVQAEFGIGRAEASLPFTLATIGFASGGVAMGRLADRFGIAVPLALGTVLLAMGYLAVGYSSSLGQVALAHGLLIGIGCSATFGPLMSDISHWFVRRRGIAVAIAAAGNYLAGTIWPPVGQRWAAGCRAQSSTSPARTRRRSSTASAGTWSTCRS
jgi:MFS family permease